MQFYEQLITKFENFGKMELPQYPSEIKAFFFLNLMISSYSIYPS